MSTIGEKVGGAVSTVQQFVVNPASAAQVVGRDAIALMIDRALTLGDPKNDSLVSFTQAARVEPLCLVDTDVLFVDELSDVLQSMSAIFTGYYLQAIQLDSTNGNVKVLETLEKFSPNRQLLSHVATAGEGLKGTLGHAFAVHKAGHGLGPGNLFSTEAYLDALPDYSVIDVIATEATGTKRQVKVDAGAFADDKSYKNWKEHRELAKASQTDRQDRERVNDRRAQKDDQKLKEKERREDRDHMLGTRQQQANDRLAQLERQKEQDLRQKKLDEERATDRGLSDAEKKAHALRQQTLDEDRNADRSQAQADREATKSKEAQTEAERQQELARVTKGYGNDALKEIKEASNLSVGKMLDIEIKHNGQVFQVPVAVRLVINTIPSSQLVHILSLSNTINSAKERFHAWKAGRLEFVKDLLFARDLIDAHRRNLMKDGDSVYTNIVKKETKNLAAALLGGTPSVSAASNMVVMSQATVDELELSMTGSFSDFHARQKIIEKTSLMIVAVVDKEWNRVTFYHRGLPDATEVSYRDLKASNKGGGPDVSDILKAYTLGNAPRM